MSTTEQTITKTSAPALVQLTSTEELIRRKLEEERLRLEREAGIEDKMIQHFARPKENPFTKAQRGHTTLLFGGLTWKHEKLIHGAFESLGYKCEAIPTPNVKAFQAGKEYGNNGQCNPTYFTVGNLVQFLQRLEADGMSRQDIINNYVFFTAGSCGPCRFGMYEAEYRFALQNAGFDGFRVLLFQQQEGIKAASGEPGLKFTVDFGMGMLNALHLADVMNDLLYQIRPFEVHQGKTDVIFPEAMDILCDTLRNRDDVGDLIDRLSPWRGRMLAWRRDSKGWTGAL